MQTPSNIDKKYIFAGVSGALLLLLIHIAYLHYFYPYIIADDAFISLRYAQHLLAGEGLTWNNGEYVEGYSNLLWVLLSAGLGWLHFNLAQAVQGLGIACTLLTPFVLLRHTRQTKIHVWACIMALLAFSITTPVAVWALAGMETPLVMLLFACIGICSWPLINSYESKKAGLIGIALGLICLLRPEGPLYTMVIAGALLVFSLLPMERKLRLAFVVCAIPFVFYLGQLAFRLHYYGHLFPNTVMAKIAFTPERLASGFGYIINALFFFAPLLAYAIINLWNARRLPEERQVMRYASFLLAIIGALSVFIVISGGDFFPCFRAFIPLLPLILLLAMHGMTIGFTYTPPKKEWIFFGYVFACYVWLQYSVDSDQLPQSHQWVRDAKEIGLALKGRYGSKQPTVAVFAAGAIPYYSELPALDVFGLNDADLTARRTSISKFGHGVIGHELFDGNYIESKKPDILAFDIPGLRPLCDEYKTECAKFLSHYRPEQLQLPGHDVTVWLRKDSPKL